MSTQNGLEIGEKRYDILHSRVENIDSTHRLVIRTIALNIAVRRIE